MSNQNIQLNLQDRENMHISQSIYNVKQINETYIKQSQRKYIIFL